MKNVGIIGVGKMGGAIAKGLEGKKFALKILDRHPVEIAAAEQVDSYLKLANCDAVLLCVKPGKGSLSVDGVALQVKDAKPLPASD